MRVWIQLTIPILTLVAAACGGRPELAPPPADAVATWEGGSLTLPELESAFAAARTPACAAARRRGGGLDDLLPCYRELAEGLAVERLALAEVADLDAAVAGLERYDELRRHAVLELHRRRLVAELEVADAEIEARFEASRERHRRPGQVILWNFFRRHRDPEKPEETMAFLRQIRQRFLAGETWDELARAHSQSETRLRGGQVGAVAEGHLPPRLERVAFALEPGGVSEPIAVRGGGVLLHVTGVEESTELPFAAVEESIRRELLGEKMRQANEALIDGREPPAGSLILAGEELAAALDGGDPERVVFEIAGDRLTARELRGLAGLAAEDRAAELDDGARERLAAIVDQRRFLQLLYLALDESADPELRAEVEEHLREAGRSEVADGILRQEMRARVDADAEALRRYFDDNRHHYQSPLRFRLRVWYLPFDGDPPRQLARMEELGERLAAGELELAAAVGELGGTVEDLGWRDFGALPERIPQKARQYLLQAGADGWSVPYQEADALHLIRIEERQEPQPLAYEEAAERVREDYLARFDQQLYRQTVDERLTAAGFAFDEEAVRRLLGGVADP